MEWFIGSLLAPFAPRVGRRLTPDLFQGSFVGSSKWFRRRVADGLSHGGGGFAIPSVAALLLPAVHGPWTVVFQFGAGGVFGGEAVDAGARTSAECCRRV